MSEPLHVGCGSIASIPRCPRYVRLCSKSGAERWGNRPAAPCGFSTLTTSAPSQASASVQDGPASNWVGPRASRTQL